MVRSGVGDANVIAALKVNRLAVLPLGPSDGKAARRIAFDCRVTLPRYTNNRFYTLSWSVSTLPPFLPLNNYCGLLGNTTPARANSTAFSQLQFWKAPDI